MNRALLVISIIVIVILVLLISHQIAKLCHSNVLNGCHLPPVYYSQIRSNLKTGDIILFSCQKSDGVNTDMNYYIRTRITGIKYMHAGLVLRRGDKYYVVECTSTIHVADKDSVRLNKKNKGGVRIIDLDLLIDRYQKEYQGTFCVRHIEKEIPNQIFIRELQKYRHVTFENRAVMITTAILDLIISSRLAKLYIDTQSPDKMMCCEFAYCMLRDCGIVKEYPSKLFWPHYYLNGKMDELGLVGYSKIINFIND